MRDVWPSQEVGERWEGLTERAALSLLAQGVDNKGIAEAL
jgi:hypothetical protein